MPSRRRYEEEAPSERCCGATFVGRVSNAAILTSTKKAHLQVLSRSLQRFVARGVESRRADAVEDKGRVAAIRDLLRRAGWDQDDVTWMNLGRFQFANSSNATTFEEDVPLVDV